MWRHRLIALILYGQSWILISAFLFLLKKSNLFYISMTLIFILEIYLLIKIETAKAYLKTQDDIDGFLYQSELFKYNQGIVET